jgi:hypothetical protein
MTFSLLFAPTRMHSNEDEQEEEEEEEEDDDKETEESSPKNRHSMHSLCRRFSEIAPHVELSSIWCVVWMEFVVGFLVGLVPRILRRLWRQPVVETSLFPIGTSLPVVSFGVATGASCMLFITLCCTPFLRGHPITGHPLMNTETLLHELRYINHHFTPDMMHIKYRKVLMWVLSVGINFLSAMSFAEFADFIVPEEVDGNPQVYTSKYHASYEHELDEPVMVTRVIVSSCLFYCFFSSVFNLWCRTFDCNRRQIWFADNEKFTFLSPCIVSIAYFVSLFILDGVSGDTLNFTAAYDTSRKTWKSHAFLYFFVGQFVGAIGSFVVSWNLYSLPVKQSKHTDSQSQSPSSVVETVSLLHSAKQQQQQQTQHTRSASHQLSLHIPASTTNPSPVVTPHPSAPLTHGNLGHLHTRLGNNFRFS